MNKLKLPVSLLILVTLLITSLVPVQAAPVYVECYVLHDYQYQEQWRSGVPEVYHLDNIGSIKLTKKLQELIMFLNPGMTAAGFRSLLKYDRAYTNWQGFDQPGAPPRADFITPKDKNAKKLPVQGKAYIGAGRWYRGTLKDGILTVKTIDTNKPLPSFQRILDENMWFYAYTVRADGTPGQFPQNKGRPVKWPTLTRGTGTARINLKVPGKPYPYLKYCRAI